MRLKGLKVKELMLKKFLLFVLACSVGIVVSEPYRREMVGVGDCAKSLEAVLKAHDHLLGADVFSKDHLETVVTALKMIPGILVMLSADSNIYQEALFGELVPTYKAHCLEACSCSDSSFNCLMIKSALTYFLDSSTHFSKMMGGESFPGFNIRRLGRVFSERVRSLRDLFRCTSNESSLLFYKNFMFKLERNLGDTHLLNFWGTSWMNHYAHMVLGYNFMNSLCPLPSDQMRLLFLVQAYILASGWGIHCCPDLTSRMEHLEPVKLGLSIMCQRRKISPSWLGASVSGPSEAALVDSATGASAGRSQLADSSSLVE